MEDDASTVGAALSRSANNLISRGTAEAVPFRTKIGLSEA
jgi:hypothetical protein